MEIIRLSEPNKIWNKIIEYNAKNTNYEAYFSVNSVIEKIDLFADNVEFEIRKNV